MVLSNIQPVLLALSFEHMLIIFLAILLLFGGKKIPELMRGLGKGIREFNDAKNNVKREIENSANEQPKDNSTTHS
jgi:sec-independent protein translocase protein TatA